MTQCSFIHMNFVEQEEKSEGWCTLGMNKRGGYQMNGVLLFLLLMMMVEKSSILIEERDAS
jgi:hypothetical protein